MDCKRVDKNNVYLDLSSVENGGVSDEAMILKDNLYLEKLLSQVIGSGYLMDVQSESRGPQLYISRKCPEFLIELFSRKFLKLARNN